MRVLPIIGPKIRINTRDVQREYNKKKKKKKRKILTKIQDDDKYKCSHQL
jgi:hypothetical protein